MMHDTFRKQLYEVKLDMKNSSHLLLSIQALCTEEKVQCFPCWSPFDRKHQSALLYHLERIGPDLVVVVAETL